MDVCDDLLLFGAYHSMIFDYKRNSLALFGGQCCVNGPYEYYNDDACMASGMWSEMLLFIFCHLFFKASP